MKLVALLCAAVLLVSFAAFASDEAGDNSKKAVAELDSSADGGAARAAQAPPRVDTTALNDPSPSARVERVREKEHPGWREVVDDGNDVLVSPFTGIAGDDSIWAERIVSGLLALLVFGVGLGFLARAVSLRGA
jgi:hypothetical protein